MAGEIFYPPPFPSQGRRFVPIPQQVDQPPRRNVAATMALVLASWPTGFEHQAPQRASTVPIPQQGDQPPRKTNHVFARLIDSWTPPDPAPTQKSLNIAPLTLAYGSQPPPAGEALEAEQAESPWRDWQSYQPYQRRITAPIPAQGDQPPRFAGILADMLIAIQAWTPPDPLPQQRRPTVPIPQQGDQPPRLPTRLPHSLWLQEPPTPQVPEQSAAITATPAVQPPYVRLQDAILSSWRTDPAPRQRPATVPIPAQGDQPPRLPTQLAYSLWVLDPPLPPQTRPNAAVIPVPATTAQVPYVRLPDAILGAWQTDDPLRARGTTVPIPAQGDQPPRCSVGPMFGLVSSWNTDPWPTQRRLFVVTAPINPPPPSSATQKLALVRSWDAPDPWPTQRRLLAPIPQQGDQPPRRSNVNFGVILRAWEPPPPMPPRLVPSQSQTVITATVAGPGWYAADDGLTYNSGGPQALFPGEARRFWIDFSPMAEIVATDTLTGTPTVVMNPSGIAATAPAVAGNRVLVTLANPTLLNLAVPGDYAATMQVDTLGGSTFVRSGWIHVPDLGTIVFPSMGSGPVPSYPAVGWVVSDDGLVYAVGGPHRKDPAEVRRYWMDFAALTEIVAGDTINAAITPSVGSSPGGLAFANVDVVQSAGSNRVFVDISSGTANTEYQVVFVVTLMGGAVISRGGTLRCVYM